MAFFVDTHCHLNFKDLGELGEETLKILQQAKQQNIGAIIDIATDLKDFSKNLAFAQTITDFEKYPQIYSAIGIHPLHIKEDTTFKKEDFSPFLKAKTLVAIGETGLDYYYSKENIKLQKEIFEQHCQAAVENNLPIIIHTRAAEEDTLEILSYFVKNHGLRGLIHCFVSNKAYAKKFLDIGFYLSFSGIVTFKNAVEIQESAFFTPKDRILTETDAPYLAPMPHRGKTNHPAYVKHTAEFLATLRGENIENFKEQVFKNTNDLFLKLASTI